MKLFALAFAALAILPASAQTPPAHNETISLKHSVPGELVRQMHWDEAANLPKGVKFIAPDARHNALIVRADADGLQKVKEIVHVLDIQPRSVEIHGYFARVTAAELDATGIDFSLVPLTTDQGKPILYARIASGEGMNAFLKTLTAQKGRISQSPSIRTVNNSPASISINSTFPGATDAQAFRTSLSVNPRINHDNSITLVVASSSGTPAAGMPTLTTLRTVKPGEMLMIHGGLQDADGNPLALFLTASEPNNKPVKP